MKIVGRFQLYFIGITHLLDQIDVLFCETLSGYHPLVKQFFVNSTSLLSLVSLVSLLENMVQLARLFCVVSLVSS